MIKKNICCNTVGFLWLSYKTDKGYDYQIKHKGENSRLLLVVKKNNIKGNTVVFYWLSRKKTYGVTLSVFFGRPEKKT